MDIFSQLPNTFIIGAAKSGTTTLSRSLAQHPAVFLPAIKEPHFFSNDQRFHKGISWYKNIFYENAHESPIRLDSSTHYLFWSAKTVPRLKTIYEYRPIKFIALFRDPAERAYSWYWHMRREQKEDLSFEEALASEKERLAQNDESFTYLGLQRYAYLKGGRYATNLKPFLKAFPRESFHFLLLDDLKNNFDETMRNVCDFLEIDCSIPIKQVMSNKASLPRWPALQSFLIRPTGPLHSLSKQITSRLPVQMRLSLKSNLKKKNLRSTSYPKLDPSIAVEIRKKLRHETEGLEKILDRDLSHWY